jgi:hypothetical protein
VIPDLTHILIADTATNAIVSGKVFRTFAEETPVAPYIVWTIISGVPENNLSDLPDIDDARIQVDCYSGSQKQSRQLGEAAQAALEPLGYVVFGPVESREEETFLYRRTIDLEFWTAR